MLSQESKVFDSPIDVIRYAKDVLDNPTIVVLPYETSPAMVVPNIDSLRLSTGPQITLSEVIEINRERCALYSQGENIGRKPARQPIAIHTVSQARVPQIIQNGLMLIMGRYGLHDETVRYYEEDDTLNLAMRTAGQQFETNPPRKELSPALRQPCHRLPITDSQIGKLEEILNDHHIPLRVDDKKYREELREQVLALYNLAGLLIRMPPQAIDTEASLAANSGQKRRNLERFFATL